MPVVCFVRCAPQATTGHPSHSDFLNNSFSCADPSALTEEMVASASGVLRAVCTADDDRPPTSKAFQHARLLAHKNQVCVFVWKTLSRSHLTHMRPQEQQQQQTGEEENSLPVLWAAGTQAKPHTMICCLLYMVSALQ